MQQIKTPLNQPPKIPSRLNSKPPLPKSNIPIKLPELNQIRFMIAQNYKSSTPTPKLTDRSFQSIPKIISQQISEKCLLQAKYIRGKSLASNNSIQTTNSKEETQITQNAATPAVEKGSRCKSIVTDHSYISHSRPQTPLTVKAQQRPILLRQNSAQLPKSVKNLHLPQVEQAKNKRQVFCDITNIQNNLEQDQKENYQLLPGPKLTTLCYTVFWHKEGRGIDNIDCEFLHSQGLTKPRQIASLTKIMTLICVLRISKSHKLNIITEKISVSERASKMRGTTATLRASDIISVHDCLYAMMLPSGNDASYALASHFGRILSNDNEESCDNETKKVATFISYMNIMANDVIKLKSTNFCNPHGLACKYSYSTAHDCALIAAYAMDNYPLIRQVVSTKIYEKQIYNINQQNERKIIWENTNKMLNQDFTGMKTGITDPAGPCLISTVSGYPFKQLELPSATEWNVKNKFDQKCEQRLQNPDKFLKKQNLIIVLLGAKNMDIRWHETYQLAQYGFYLLAKKFNSYLNQ